MRRVALVLAACLVCLACAAPTFPTKYLTQFSYVDSAQHEDYSNRIVVAVDEAVGLYAELQYGGGFARLMCTNETVGLYDCYVSYYTDDPVTCQYIRTTVDSVYDLDIIGHPSDDLVYIRSEVIDGAIVEHWFDDQQNLDWVVRRDKLQLLVQVLSTDMSAPDIMVDTFSEVEDISSFLVPPAVECSMAPAATLPTLMGKRSVKQVPQVENEQAFVDMLNARPGYSWTARASESELTVDALSMRLGVILTGQEGDIYEPLKSSRALREDLPENFDAREKWPGLLHDIYDQGHCGSCWAHASAGSFGDRMAIATEGEMVDGVSRQYLISCDLADSGCRGGNSFDGSKYIRDSGLPSEKCVPTYKSLNGTVPVCPLKCEDESTYTLYKGVDAFHVVGEENIKYELYHYGPLRADFMVYSDILVYADGVYEHDPNLPLLGGHAVRLIGWGVDEVSNKPYWLLMNSWGTKWGIQGAFKIIRGKNDCEIEEHVTGNHAPKDETDNLCNYAMCQNGAKCESQIGTARCVCAPAFAGAYCGTWVDPCASNPCNGRGLCTSTKNTPDYQCYCVPPFGGATCAEVKCGAFVPVKGYDLAGECSGNMQGDTCDLVCANGYKGAAAQAVCKDGTWTVPDVCSSVSCGKFPESKGYSVKECAGELYGDVCHLTCASGYEGTAGITMCSADGKWTTAGGCENTAEKKKVSLGTWSIVGISSGTILTVVGAAFIAFFVGTKRGLKKSGFAPVRDTTINTTDSSPLLK